MWALSVMETHRKKTKTAIVSITVRNLFESNQNHTIPYQTELNWTELYILSSSSTKHVLQCPRHTWHVKPLYISTRGVVHQLHGENKSWHRPTQPFMTLEKPSLGFLVCLTLAIFGRGEDQKSLNAEVTLIILIEWKIASLVLEWKEFGLLCFEWRRLQDSTEGTRFLLFRFVYRL